MIKFFIIIAFIAGASNMFFALLVLLKDRKALSNRLFGLFSLSFALWTFSYGIWLLQDDVVSALFWSRMLNLGATFIPILVLHWILYLLDQKKKILLIFGYLLTTIFALFSFSPYYIKDVQQIFIFPYWPQAGSLYTIYLFVAYIGFFGYAFYQMLKLYKSSTDITRQKQIQYLLGGSLMGVIGGATNFPLMYGISLMPPYGMFLIIFHPIIFTYAIFKHHLFNLKVITAELFTVLLFIILSVRFALSESPQQFLINGFILIGFAIFGILLIRSVWKEVRMREEKERLAQELETANEKLKKLDQAKSDFVTITSHQLRSPVTAIKGYASMLSEGTFGEIPEKAKMAVERIFQSSNRLVALIGDFLNLSRIERGKMEYDFKKVDLREMIKGIIDEFKAINLTEKKNLDLSFNVSEKEDFMATIDSDKIRQVIYNLIDNAMKYTKTGFIKVFLCGEPEKRAIGLRVEDSGIGMSQEALGQIFEKFTRAEGASALHTEGTGLGLYVAKEILKAHEGTIWAESEGQGKGSTFCVELPYEK